VQRPLFIVENGLIKLKKEHVARFPQEHTISAINQQHGSLINFDETLKMGLIEFLDVEEEETAMIAMHIKDLRVKDPTHVKTYTHCEIHPSMILGVCASIIPFPDHNQVSPCLND
jgi:DNA-directed RNA polymerase II subunit RPB2